MIPTLFQRSVLSFDSNGSGRFVDAISCSVYEKLNGDFYLEMVYPVTGELYSLIELGSIIYGTASKLSGKQAFVVYRITRPLNGQVTIYANHISYRLSYIPVKPFNATGIANIMAGLKSNALETCPFNFSTDLTDSTTSYYVNYPTSIRKQLGTDDGMILNTFGGEYEWDNLNVRLLSARGSDNNVYLRYGKNITKFEHDLDSTNTITGALGYWVSSDSDDVIYGTIQYNNSYQGAFPWNHTVTIDCSSEFTSKPTTTELNNYAANYISNYGKDETSITMSVVDLEAVNEGIDETYNLGDTVHVIFTKYGLSYSSEITETTWDVLNDKFTEIVVGEPKDSLDDTVANGLTSVKTVIGQTNKLVTVTETIDQSLGIVNQTISEVQENVSVNSDDISNLSNSVTEQLTSTSNQINLNKSNISTLQRESSSIAATVSSVNSLIGYSLDSEGNATSSVTEEVSRLSTTFKILDSGTYVYSNGETTNYFKTDANGCYVYTNNTLSASFEATYSLIKKLIMDENWTFDVIDGGNQLCIYRQV